MELAAEEPEADGLDAAELRAEEELGAEELVAVAMEPVDADAR